MNPERIIAIRNTKTVYRDGENCLKVFAQSHSPAEVLREALLQAEAECAGVCVPRIKEVSTMDGKWVIVSEYVEGQTLEQLLREQPEKRADYLSLFVHLQLRVQTATCHGLPRQKDDLLCGLLEADIDPAVRVHLSERLTNLPETDHICHGDFVPSNIVLRPDGTPCLLDWSCATRGDVATDAATTLLKLRMAGGWLAETCAAPYLALYAEKSGIASENIRRLIPLVAAAQLAHSHATAREFLRNILQQNI